MKTTDWIVFICLVCPAWAARRRNQPRTRDNCVDMTHPMNEGMIHFPKLQAFLLNTTHKEVVDVKFQMEVMTTATHMGTHMDAPLHFNEKGISIDKIPIEKFNNVPAYVVDVRPKTQKNAEYQIDVTDLEEFEKKHNTSITNGSLVLFLTGWGKKWDDVTSFLGTDQDDPTQLKFPGLSPLLSTLLAQRAIAGVGTECVSVDPNGESTKTAHRTILNSPHSMYILENLANLEQLPPKGIKVNAYPMKIKGGSGAPARVIACFRQRAQTQTGASSKSGSRRNRNREKPTRF